MRRLHLALVPILAQVAGPGKNVVPFFGPWAWGCFLGNRPQPAELLPENMSFAHKGSRGIAYFVAWE
jgi:hypothetical protein